MLTHFSLFTGIGGADIAAEWAGFKTIGQVEWADYPTKVLEKHWPNTPRWRDIHNVRADNVLPIIRKYGGVQSPSLAEDSHVSHSVLQESEKAKMMTVSSGLKCLESYQNSSPLGSLVKMLMGSSIWASKMRVLTWKVKAMKCNRLLYQLVPSVQSMKENVCSLLPTPNSSEEKKLKMSCESTLKHFQNQRKKGNMFSLTLAELALINFGELLNPNFVEEMMGFQQGWTDLNV